MTHKYIKVLVFCLVTLFSSNCSTVPVPDMGKRKVAGKTYVAVQKRCCGMNVGKPIWKEQPSQWDKTRAMLQAPAQWTLAIALPLALIAFAASAFISVPQISKWSSIIGCIAGMVAIGCAAWLLATMYLLLLIPLVILAAVFIYFKTHEKGLTWNKGGTNGTVC